MAFTGIIFAKMKNKIILKWTYEYFVSVLFFFKKYCVYMNWLRSGGLTRRGLSGHTKSWPARSWPFRKVSGTNNPLCPRLHSLRGSEYAIFQVAYPKNLWPLFGWSTKKLFSGLVIKKKCRSHICTYVHLSLDDQN